MQPAGDAEPVELARPVGRPRARLDRRCGRRGRAGSARVRGRRASPGRGRAGSFRDSDAGGRATRSRSRRTCRSGRSPARAPRSGRGRDPGRPDPLAAQLADRSRQLAVEGASADAVARFQHDRLAACLHHAGAQQQARRRRRRPRPRRSPSASPVVTPRNAQQRQPPCRARGLRCRGASSARGAVQRADLHALAERRRPARSGPGRGQLRGARRAVARARSSRRMPLCAPTGFVRTCACRSGLTRIVTVIGSPLDVTPSGLGFGLPTLVTVPTSAASAVFSLDFASIADHTSRPPRSTGAPGRRRRRARPSVSFARLQRSRRLHEIGGGSFPRRIATTGLR